MTPKDRLDTIEHKIAAIEATAFSFSRDTNASLDKLIAELITLQCKVDDLEIRIQRLERLDDDEFASTA